ncbi:tetratricopeptide repeat protein [Chryseobacterium sp. G0201]|uniref:tetratricopeptide repeat protein n=1 Tax=Chryseobacterium sp. G0201 TaxID=2487065 RepID=UPI000F50BAA3|nr:tetratricopeptide repeat protein [Chryseobacterium sp. G0201]AZA53637.1 hypothetical protein EG348_11745 [Chryseobacterium sp. G0201]
MKNFLYINLIFISTVIFGQEKIQNQDLILFERAITLQEFLNDNLNDEINQDTINLTEQNKLRRNFAIELKENTLEKVISNYDELIKEFPQSKLIFRALNNKGFAEIENGNYDNAKKTFQKILNSNADDLEKIGVGSGIMGEPYSNYKNRALKTLARIEIRDRNYQQAVQYLNETKKYPYRHFCGNEYAQDEIAMAELYSQCYIKLEQHEKAFDILIPNIIENGIADNSEITILAYNTLIKKYHKEDLKTLFENSFKNIIIRSENKFTSYNINFLNRNIRLPDWELSEAISKKDKEDIIKQILKNSKFYSLLSK